MEQLKRRNNSKRNKIIFFCLFILIIIGLLVFYFVSDFSKIKSVKIINQTALSDKYIQENIDIKTGDIWIFTFPKMKKDKVLQKTLIKDLQITTSKNHSVIIEVKQDKIVGYCLEKEDDYTNNYLIVEDGSKIDFVAGYLKNITLIPLINVNNEEVFSKVITNIEKIDPKIASHICQINLVSFTYDANMVELIMSEGYYIYSSIDDLLAINYYFDIICNSIDDNNCILITQDYSKAILTTKENIAQYLN